MRRRRIAALLAVCCLGILAGCFGPSEIPEDDLQGDAEYDWDSDAEVTYTLSRSSYQGVYNVSNRSTLTVHTSDALGIENPIQVRSLQFRFVNGTVVNATHANLSATVVDRRTDISLPAEEGKVAYTASRSGKQFSRPVAIEGAYAVVLPPNTRVGVPLLSQVSPGNYSTNVSDGRMTVFWPEVTQGAVTVQYYLQRDLLLFSGLLIGAIAVGIGGAVYYLRQIRRARSRREEVGLDVEEEDDEFEDDGPPPGVR